MRNTSKLPQIKIPGVALGIQALLLDPCGQRVVILDPLAPAGNLAVPFWSQKVDREREFGIQWIRLVIERLRLLRIPGDEERPIDIRRQNLLLLIAQIITPLDPRLLLTDHLESIVVGDSWKWRLDLLQVLSLSAEQSQLSTRLLKQLSNDIAQHLLLNFHDSVQINVRCLCFKMPIFCEVPAGPGLFRPKRGGDGVDLADRGDQSFRVS